MFALHFTVAALLCGTINVAAAPTPPPPFIPWTASNYPSSFPGHMPHQFPSPYDVPPPATHVYHPVNIPAGGGYLPQINELFDAPSKFHTHGELKKNRGHRVAGKIHPHVYLGLGDHGELDAAALTHTNHAHLKPMYPMPPNIGVDGFARLGVTVPVGAASRRHGHILPPHHVAPIRAANDLVKQHHKAADENERAAEAQHNQAAIHNNMAASFTRLGKTVDAAYYKRQANIHRAHGLNHDAAVNSHRWAAHRVTGPDPGSLQHAKESAEQARHVHESLKGSQEHTAAFHSAVQRGDEHNQGYHFDIAERKRLSANDASIASIRAQDAAVRGHH